MRGVKALRPTDVRAIMLTPLVGTRLSSVSEWTPSTAEVFLKTSTIAREIGDISLTSTGMYTRRQQVHPFSLYGNKANRGNGDDAHDRATFEDDEDDQSDYGEDDEDNHSVESEDDHSDEDEDDHTDEGEDDHKDA